MHTKGANQTPSTSQFHSACRTSSWSSGSQPVPRIAYPAAFAYLSLPGPENIRGKPNETASVAAREKLSTAVIEITVEARQRLMALRILCIGAAVLGEVLTVARERRKGNWKGKAMSKGYVNWKILQQSIIQIKMTLY